AELDPQWIVLILIAFIFGLTVCGFAVVHGYYIINNETTIEHLTDRPYEIRVDFDTSGQNFEVVSVSYDKNLWDIGKSINWKMVMGENALYWFVPVKRGLGDGHVFPLNDERYTEIVNRAHQQRKSLDNSNYQHSTSIVIDYGNEDYFNSHEHNQLPRHDCPPPLIPNTHVMNKPNIPPTPINTAKSLFNQTLNEKIDFRFGPLSVHSIDPTPHTKKKKKKKETHGPETELQLGYGVIHLYRDINAIAEDDLPDTKIAEDESLNINSTEEDDKTMIGILAVPSYMTHKDLIHFIGTDNANISHYRFIRDYSPNKYMVLLKFKNRQTAYRFYMKFNGRRFNMTEPEISHVVYIRSNSISTVTIPPESYPYLSETLLEDREHPVTSLAELPTCPVCLERMDESITGLLGIQCHHITQCFCLDKWGEGHCPVCLYSQKPTIEGKGRSTNKRLVMKKKMEICACFECASTDSLWICMICGHIGCGRYQDAHAYDHYMDTKHLYALEIETQRIWDYVGDGYIHRLIQNTIDGALVELPGARSTRDNKMISSGSNRSNHHSMSSVNTQGVADSQGKLDAVSFDYTHMLISQLDSQRVYFEEQLHHLTETVALLKSQVEDATLDVHQERKKEERLRDQKSALSTTLVDVRKDKEKIEKKVSHLKDKIQSIENKLREENELTKSLLHNNNLLKMEADSKDATIEVLNKEGTSADQDSRFSNKEKKLLKSMTFPPHFEQKIDMKKVNLDVIKPWIHNRIVELLGFEDELVINYTCTLLEEKDQDPKKMQINLTGFLHKHSASFMSELWTLLLSAQDSIGGIPAIFIEQKKEELRKKQLEEDERRARKDSVMGMIKRKTADEVNDTSDNRRKSRFDDKRQHSQSPTRKSYRSHSRSRSRDGDRRRHRDSYYSRRDDRDDRRHEDRSHREDKHREDRHRSDRYRDSRRRE
ncbi:hypothetical protein BDB01DRAFT_723314, partial [Pilobolus umbonatus]